MDHPYQQYSMSPMTPTTSYSASSSQRDLLAEPKTHRVMERKPVLYTTGTGFTETEPPIYSAQPGPRLTSSMTCADSQRVSPTSTIAWWWIEILSALGALICMLALVILLRFYENKPQPNWDMISLNTVVVAISTTSRTLFMIPVGAALSQGAWIWFSPEKQKGKIHSKLSDLEIFDEASRGPWGSLRLLFRMKFMFHLASIGSLITLLTLGFDIFTQQLLASEVRLMDSDRFTAGTVPRAEHYDKWQHGAISGIKDVVFEAKASIYSGILTENINPLAVTCSSGNCTWPTIPTLGVCGSCTKTTYNKSCETIYLGSVSNSYEECNFTLPSGTTIEGIKDTFSFQDAFSVVPVTQSNTSIYSYADETTPYLSIFDMIGTYYQGNDFNANTTATECALWLCLQAYEITVNNTDQIQKTTQTYSSIIPVESPIYNYTANRTFANIPASFNVDPTINYTMEGYAFYAFQNALWNVFSGNVTSGMGSATWDYTNDFIQGIWNGTSGTWNTTGDPDAWIQNLALSMTNSIRSLGSSTEDTGRYAGVVQSPQIFVRVRWNWIILPAVLVVATLIYLALIVMETRNGDVRGAAWKGSPLSMLIADVDPGVRERARGWEMKKDGVENMVGGIEARLVRGPYGGGLRGSDEDLKF